MSPRYRALITAGLAASLAGDVFLMLPGDRFVVSDSALAIGRFRGDFTGGTLLVLGSDWLAQWLIARSVTRAGTR